jgi:hypothetical protein
MKKMNLLNGAGVLLIAAILVFSTIAVTADTELEPVLTDGSSNQGQGGESTRDIVWDNGMNYDGLLAAQEPVSPGHVDAYPADDFHFEVDTEVCDVHWIGGYYNGDPEPWDWCILFYYDRGDGNAPGNIFEGPFCYSWADIGKEELEPGRYEMWVDLPYNIWFPGCYKFWISIWAVGDHFPQSGWGFHFDPITLHEAVFKSDWFGFPDWTDTSQLLGDPIDMCFQLTSKECEPSIDVEKYVWDPVTQEWVDADDPGSAVDLVICTEATFKIVIHNDGDECCGPIFDILVYDVMEDSLEFISADPPPDEWTYDPPYYYLWWYFPGPLFPCEIIEIYITAHVVGPECTIDYNYVEVLGHVDCPPFEVFDEDYAYVHAIEPPEPAICCEGEIEWLDVKPGETVTATFEVCNCGDEGSFLNWEICGEPEWGEDWTFDPASGTDLAYDECVEVEVSVKAPDEENAEFEGEIEACNSDDPDDSCTVPVKLVTPCDIPSFLELLMQRFPILGQILLRLIL